ncbi:MAG: phospholipase A [Steroidobacteraceae bacterium]
MRHHQPDRAGPAWLISAALIIPLSVPLAARAQSLGDCTTLDDDADRLLCYDQIAGRTRRSAPTSDGQTPAAEATANADAPRLAPAEQDGQDGKGGKAPENQRVATGTTNMGGVAETFTTAWELAPQFKRGTFVLRTYLPNFLLPAHYSLDMNRYPESPTHDASDVVNYYRQIEAKLQISLRAKVLEDFLLPNADLWVAYTQQSFWQVWDHKDSAPFRSTDYQPEALYVVPVPKLLTKLPFGWHWSMAQVGIAHQSNGQTDPLSRSWNRVYLGASLEHGELGLLLRENFRMKEDRSTDDNPDLVHYLGTTEATLAWLPGRATAALTWKLSPDHPGRGSWQLDWTYPLHRSQPQGLRYYVQIFTGYGETLLDYNHRQTSAGVGMTLFQW